MSGMEQQRTDPFRGNGVWAVTDILTDLIAELRGMADQGLDSGWAPLYEVADRAEARLRETAGSQRDHGDPGVGWPGDE